MKRPTSIIAIVPSAIIVAGIKSLAASLDEWDVSVATAEPDAAPELAARISPAMILADPMALHPDDIATLRSAGPARMRLVALSAAAIPAATAAAYDTILSVYASPDELKTLIADTASQTRRQDVAADDDRRELSPREKDVVIGVAKGLSNKEIATAMAVSVNTVTTHRRNIAAKLKIHSPAGLTIYAIAQKLVTLDEVAVD